MTDVRQKVLADAAKIIRRRGNEHGHTERSFTMIAELWSTYIKHVAPMRELNAYDVAQMMTLVKKARATYGFSIDNFTDDAGYTALAADLHPKMKSK